jgi:phosphoglycerate dehydrogenase-like enzyme
MHVVVVDRNVLPPDTEFPALAIPRYGWEEYGNLAGSELVARCWRADVIVTFRTPLPPETLAGLVRLKLIVIGDGVEDIVDLKSASAQAIVVAHVDERVCDPAGKAREITAIIEAFHRGEPRNVVAPLD